MVLFKEVTARQEKTGMARFTVYTAHFIRAGLVFLVRVPMSPVLGLLFLEGPSTGEILVRCHSDMCFPVICVPPNTYH